MMYISQQPTKVLKKPAGMWKSAGGFEEGVS
jgi:hypothetical protein